MISGSIPAQRNSAKNKRSLVKKAAATSDMIRFMLDSGDIFEMINFTPMEACRFLREMPQYEQVGILCRVPNWWSASPRKLSLALVIGDIAGGKLGAQALLTCKPMLHIGGEEITVEEAREILAHYDGPAMIKSDLQEKIEMKTWAILSKKQRVLYQRFVNDLSDAMENSEGIQRKGLILSSLLKFKQVCNHPDQIAGTGRFREEDSGNLQRLREISESIHEKRERVLVFTQFREMVGPLDDFLKTVFGRSGVQLHGGTAVGKRKERVAAFQNENVYVPYFVLSLKAGGVGLNLTATNHVIHFDRWWNPAVEIENPRFGIPLSRNVWMNDVSQAAPIASVLAKNAGGKPPANHNFRMFSIPVSSNEKGVNSIYPMRPASVSDD